MELYCLHVSSNNIGGYFSSEQLDLLSIIQCKTYDEVIDFLHHCKQFNGTFSKEELQDFENYDLEQLKRHVFKCYQDTLVLHNSDRTTVLNNTLERLSLKQEDIDIIKKVLERGKRSESLKYISQYIQSRYPNHYEEIIRQAHQFVSVERDQNKGLHLYDELVIVNERLSMFDTLLVGSLKPEVVINELAATSSEDRFDFYFVERDLDFALRNNKHVRLHSLLTKWANEKLFDGKSKEEVLGILTDYVKTTIDFVNEYNATHMLADGTSVINSIDLFNEIVSFHKNDQGEYENIWESKYGISIQDICDVFLYAKEHKPDGVSYLYNEPFLEDSERRKKCFSVLENINSTSDGLIDTLGSQMHINFETSDEQIQDCFSDFKLLQDTLNMDIQITEFDLSLSENEALKTIGLNPQASYLEVYDMKRDRVNHISSIINDSSVRLSGVSYWSLTDNTASNLERVRTNLLEKGIIDDIYQVPTTCGGLIPTSSQYVDTQHYSSYVDDSSTLKK